MMARGWGRGGEGEGEEGEGEGGEGGGGEGEILIKEFSRKGVLTSLVKLETRYWCIHPRYNLNFAIKTMSNEKRYFQKQKFIDV